MSEHIKTGDEIFGNINKMMEAGVLPEGLLVEQWVSLEWLQDQVKRLRQFQEVAPEYYDAIKEVLALLEEK